MSTRTKPWTVDDPPSCAQNWTREERGRCVEAANEVLAEGGTDEEAVFACIHAAGKMKQHPHGEHVCYCPGCGHVETVGANEKCNEQECPGCGQRMRAVESGEFQNMRETRAMKPAVFTIEDKTFRAGYSVDADGALKINEVVEAKAAQWTVGADRDLPISEREEWDGDAAKAHIWTWAGFDGDNPDSSKARRCFLVYDASEPELKRSYKLPFADIIDGSPKAIPNGIRNAAGRLPQTHGLGSDVETRARAVLDGYLGKMGSKGYMPGGVFKTFEHDGKAYWVAISSTAFRDREKEIVSREAMDYAIKFADETGLRGFLNLYHIPTVKLGACDIMMRVDEVLLEAGRWFDNEYANAVRRSTAKEWSEGDSPSMSIEFWYDPDQLDEDNTYHKVIIFNRAVLKHKHAANPWTWFKTSDGAEKSMSEKQDLIDLLDGDEVLAEKVLTEAAAHSKEVRDSGIEFKEADMPDEILDEEEATEEKDVDEVTEEVAEEDVTEAKEADPEEEAATEEEAETVQEVVIPEETVKALVEKVGEEYDLKGLVEQVSTLAALLEELRKTDEQKIMEKMKAVPKAVLRETKQKAATSVKEDEIIDPPDETAEDAEDARTAHFKSLRALGT